MPDSTAARSHLPVNFISLCSGIGGLDRAVEEHFGATLVAYAETDKDASAVMARHWAGVPNIGDLRTVRWEDYGADILCAGFPCQPVSTAGRRAGTDDERWLFDDICSALSRMDPRPGMLVFENVRGLLSANDGHAMGRIIHGLASLGYVGSYGTLAASAVGAPHRRERVFIVAWDATLKPWSIVHGEPIRATGDAERPRADAFATQGAPWDRARESGGDAADADSQRRPRRQEQDERTVEPGLGTSRRSDIDGLGVDDGAGLTLLPTPRSAADRASRASLVRDGHWSAPSLTQAIELAAGILPREYDSWDEVQGWHGALLPTPVARADLLPTPCARLGTPRGAHADRYVNPERSNDLDDAAAWAEREGRWGDYAEAIARWEAVTGEAAPEPLDGKRLSPDFVEWMMGFPEGWCDTLIPSLSRTAKLRLLGNAVVTRQASAALSLLTARLIAAYGPCMLHVDVAYLDTNKREDSVS